MLRYLRLPKFLGLGLLAALAMTVWLAAPGQAHAVIHAVSIDSAAVAPGETTTVDLKAVAPGTGLGSWTIDVIYDPAVIDATACTSHPSGGCNVVDSDTVRFAGSVGDPAGLAGGLTLGGITFLAIGAVNACSGLTIDVAQFNEASKGDDATPGLAVTGGSILITATPVPGETCLTTSHSAGSFVLEVGSQVGFEVGDGIVIDPDTAVEEENEIAAFGSFILVSPLQFDHPAGARVVKIVEATPAVAAATATPAAAPAVLPATGGSSLEGSGGFSWPAAAAIALGLALLASAAWTVIRVRERNN